MSTDFFVSYTGADLAWAEWIAFALEEAGFTATIQAWDFRPGANFVLAMQAAASAAERTIMVLSPTYLRSGFAAPEWAAAFADDPRGMESKLVPVRIEPCDPPGLLKSIVHIDLVGLGEAEARAALLLGVDRKRAKPSRSPTFPGAPRPRVVSKAFPGASGPTTSSHAAPARRSHMPVMSRPASNADKRQLLRRTMQVMRDHFRDALVQVERGRAGVTTDLEEVSGREFIAEIFLDGKSRARCRIWQGGLMSDDGISYAEGTTASIGGGINETLSVAAGGPELVMKSLMGAVASGVALDDLDLQRLSAEDAAEYLWRRFTSRLG